MNLETALGPSSWRFLANAGYNSFREGDAGENIFYSGLGVGYVARNFDIRIWGSVFADALGKAGYNMFSNYYFNDFTWISYSQGRNGVESAQALSESLMQTSYDLSANRRVGAKDLYTVGYTWSHYTDSNRARGFYWRFGHMSLDTLKKEVEWYVYGSHYTWDRVSDYYDSPSSRVGYGPGLRLRWKKPRGGYWEFISELSFTHDRPERTEFAPFVRLERGWNISARSLLVAGVEMGRRTDRTNDLTGLKYGYKQFDIRYYLTW
jgi:hypothetical protein